MAAEGPRSLVSVNGGTKEVAKLSEFFIYRQVNRDSLDSARQPLPAGNRIDARDRLNTGKGSQIHRLLKSLIFLPVVGTGVT